MTLADGLSGPLADGRCHRLSDLPLQPWRNGAGETRELACLRRPGDAEPVWRVSAAELRTSGPFSTFSGRHRQAMLIAPSLPTKPFHAGEGAAPLALTLRVDGRPLVLRHLGDQQAFDGEAEVSLDLPGGPARFWNVMTRRGAASAALRCWRASELAASPVMAWSEPVGTELVQILLVLAGAIRVLGPDGVAVLVQAGELCLWTQAPSLQCTVASPDAIGVQTTLAVHR